MKMTYWILLGAAAVLLLAATFADLPAAQALYNPSIKFGRLLSTAFIAPVLVLMPMSVGILFGVLIKKTTTLGVVLRIVAPLLVVFGVFAVVEETHGFHGGGYIPFRFFVYIAVSVFLLATVLGAYSSRKYTKPALTASIVGIIAVSGGFMLLGIFNDIWGRQSFNSMDNPAAQFTVWYEPQFPSEQKSANMGEKINSFPSVQSFAAISILWVAMFVNFLGFCQKNEKMWANIITVIALCFFVFSSAIQLITGKHFLSDIAAAAIIFLVMYMVSNAIFNDNNFRIRSNAPRRKVTADKQTGKRRVAKNKNKQK